jgi:opacity protein-like surface antigen
MSKFDLIRGALAAAVLGLALVTAAPARADLMMSGGTAGSMPMGSPNAGLGPLLGVSELSGLYGATIESDGAAANLRYEFLGYEAGFDNGFAVAGVTVFRNSDEPGGDRWSSLTDPFEAHLASDQSGVIDFSFIIDGDVAVRVGNGSNPDVAGGTVGPNFFAHQLDDGSILLWLDDGGSDNDNDHDDMVIRIVQVP